MRALILSCLFLSLVVDIGCSYQQPGPARRKKPTPTAEDADPSSAIEAARDNFDAARGKK